MTQKPTIMILGSGHLAEHGRDVVNFKMDDVRTPKRQREIKQLVKLLKRFEPTKMAVEVEPEDDAELHTKYQGYLQESYQLERSEVEQIGFRLAKEMGHSKVYPVDWKKPPPVDLVKVDFVAFAEANNQKHLLEGAFGKSHVPTTDGDTIWIEPEGYEPLIEEYRRINQDETIRAGHQIYLVIA